MVTLVLQLDVWYSRQTTHPLTNDMLNMITAIDIDQLQLANEITL